MAEPQAKPLYTEMEVPVPETSHSNQPSDIHRRTPTRDEVVAPKLSSSNLDVLKPMGFPSSTFQEVSSVPIEESNPFEYEGYEFDINSLKQMITNPNNTTKIRPVLVSFSGLPECGKTMAVQHILKNYVNDSPFTPITKRIEKQEAAGISYYELVAAGLNPLRDLCITEVTQQSSLAAGILSALKTDISVNNQIPLFNLYTTQPIQPFENRDLDDHIQFIYRYLCDQESIPKGPALEEKEKEYAKKLQKVLPEGIALINIWDLSINETVRHFLAALQGRLYNNNSWLFLDLERDFDHLDEPPVIRKKEGKSEEAVFMKWRPRLHYMLRSCRMSENIQKDKQRKRMCTVFAKHDGTSNGDLQKKIDKLERKVRNTAKHIGFSQILEEKIQTINLSEESGITDNYSRRLYQKFQQVIYETPFENIPLVWVFLRSFLYRYEKKFILREDLKDMAAKCGMDDDSFNKFCQFYTSFGSIFDLSLVNPEYSYVIVKPIEFLKSLDKCLCPEDTSYRDIPLIKNGIISNKECRAMFGGDWPVFTDALVSLNLAVRITGAFIESDQIDRHEVYHYVSLSRSRKSHLVTDVDQNSVHVITSIDTPHVFKQVALTKRLLKSLPNPKLIPCPNINRTIIKDVSSNTTLTIVSHSPATRLHLDKPNVEMCSRIVEAYRDIAATCGVTTKYKFVVLCSDCLILDVQSIPSSRYHILPDDKLCEVCKEKSETVNAWNEALMKCPIDKNSQPTGDLKASELAAVSEKLASFDIKAGDLAKHFKISNIDHLKEYLVVNGDENLAALKTDDKIVNEIILAWYREQRVNGNKDIRRSFAIRLSELRKNLSEDEKQECERMAKEIDAYYKPE